MSWAREWQEWKASHQLPSLEASQRLWVSAVQPRSKGHRASVSEELN